MGAQHPDTQDEGTWHGIRLARHPGNDLLYPEQWHLAPLKVEGTYETIRYTVNGPSAWSLSRGQGVNVAILDTGIARHHDLEGQVLAGYDFIADPFHANDGDGRDADPSDPGDWVTFADRRRDPECAVSDSSWHGTHMAGIVAAITDNALGGGIASQAKILPVRVLGKCGGWLSDIIDGIYWAAGLPVPDSVPNLHPARVLNLSLSARGSCPQSLQMALDAAFEQGAVVVVAAGNDAGSASLKYPGNCAGVVTVAATDRLGQRAAYSATGGFVDFSAPGGDRQTDSGILSTSNRGTTVPLNEVYEALYGTSMAAAQVAGVVALMLAVQPQLPPEMVKEALRTTATPFPQYGHGYDCTPACCGAGIVRADWAVLAAQGVDFVPNPFAFAPRYGVPLATPVTSEPVVIQGLAHATHVSVQNGEYSLGCTERFTRQPGEISNGQSVCVRHISAASPQAEVTTILTVGGVRASFTSTTQGPSGSPPTPSSGAGSLDLAVAMILALLAAWRCRSVKA